MLLKTLFALALAVGMVTALAAQPPNDPMPKCYPCDVR
jgi:hypothetical protein